MVRMLLSHVASPEFAVSVGVSVCPIAAMRILSAVSIVGIEMVINVAAKMLSHVKPATRADEHAAAEPFWTVIAIRSTSVRRIIKVPIRAHRRSSDGHADLTGPRLRHREQNPGNRRKEHELKSLHSPSFLLASLHPQAASHCRKAVSVSRLVRSGLHPS